MLRLSQLTHSSWLFFVNLSIQRAKRIVARTITLPQRFITRTLFVLLFTVVCIGAAQGQLPPGNKSSVAGWTPLTEQPGAPAGSYALSGFDNINLFNGHMNFRLPLLHIGGRGSAGYTMTLPIEQHWIVQTVAVPTCNQSGCTYNPANYRYIANPVWWTGLLPGYGPGVLMGRQSGDDLMSVTGCGSGVVFVKTLTRLTFTGPDGTEYEFRDALTNGQPTSGGPPGCFEGFNRGKVFVTGDGSAATFVSDSDIKDYRQPPSGPATLLYPSGYMMLRDGTRFRIDGGLVTWIRDANGNKISFTYSGSSVTGIDDSLNRHISITYGSPDVISFKGMGGATRTIKVYHDIQHNVLRKHPDGSTEYTIKTFQQLYPALQNPQQGNCDLGVLSAVELPDGRQYQFRYDSYANLAQVILPTGGRFEYDWTNSTYSFGDYVWGIYERVLERRTALDPTTPAYETRMTYSASASPAIVDTFDPKNGNVLLARSKHYFSGNWLPSLLAKGTDYPKWQDGREYQTEEYAADGTTLLRRINQSYQQRASVGWWTGSSTDAPPNDPRLVETTNTLVDTNQVSKTSAINPYTGAVGFDQYNNPTDVWEYDFGSGSPGALLRHTVTSYLTSGYDTLIPNSSNPNLSLTYHLRSLPSQVSIYDAGGTERARTAFEYDNYLNDSFHAALVDRLNISGHDSAVSTSYVNRGNPTGVSRYLLPAGTAITAYSQFDIAGNLTKVIDPRSTVGNVIATTIGYDDNFGSPDGSLAERDSFTELGSQQTFAFPTQVTNALNQSAYSQYSYYLGQTINQQDFNGVIVAGYHTDLLDRLTQVRRAYGTGAENQTTFEYDDVNRTVATKTDLNTNNDSGLITKTIYDGLGRTIESRQYEGGTNFIAIQTQYDGAGRPFKTSNPFRPWQSETAIWSTSAFDALGRITSVTTPDNASVTTSYVGNSTTVTDQAGKARKSVTDGLGRLSTVYEDPYGLNYQTSYQYDVLDDLTTVTQGAQTRSFSYDSLKRLLSATNPESGAVNYSYDNGGNLISRVDARSITTTLVYDALNRITSQTYNDNPQTPTINYFYDAQTLPTGAPSFNRGYSTGRLVAVTYGGASAGNYRGFDELGRVVRKYQQTDAVNYLIEASYYANSALNVLTYPSVPGASDRRTVTYTNDSAGRLASLTSPATTFAPAASVSGITYTSHNALASETYGNSLIHGISYNNRLQPLEIKLGTSGSPTSIVDLVYNYGTTNNNGNVQSISYSGGGLSYTQSFGYDALNRLTTSQENGGSSWSQTNGYDQYGNRWIDYGGGIHNLSFSTANNRITTSGYSYDGAGNLTNDTLHIFTFDAENKIRTVNGTSAYVYDGEGQRVRKLVGENLRFIYGIGGEELAEFDGGTGSLKKEYIYGASGLVATIEPTAVNSNGTRYTTADTLGSPRVITNSSAGVVSRHDYMPFGEELGSGVGGRTSGMGFGVADGQRQKFTHKERDIETGLDYFGYRYFSSMQGRWTSVDPKIDFDRNVGEPQAWNLYQYCVNNPLARTDPDGQQDSVRLNGNRALEQELRKNGLNEKQIKQFMDELRKSETGVLVGLIAGSVVGRIGPPVIEALLMWAARNPDKVEQGALSVQEMAGGPPGLTLLPNSRLTQEEIVTGERLGKQLGVRLLEGSHVGEEYIIPGTKKTIDAMGTPQAFANWNAKEFTGSIIRHLNKSVDYVAIDLAGASKSQVQTIKKFVQGLTEEQRKKIIYVQ